MNVSWNNLAKTATLSATNENVNKPVENIVHNYLELAFYATGNNSVITIELDADANSIDHIAYGYHDISTMNLKFIDVLAVEITNFNVTPGEDENFYYFDTITSVKTIEITLTTTGTLLYVGGISVGEYLELPRFIQSPNISMALRDSDFLTGGGQASGNRRRTLKSYPLLFRNVSNANKVLIEEYLRNVQKSIPHFIDIYPDGHDYIPAKWAKIINSDVKMSKRRISNWEWDIDLSYIECR